MAKKFTQSTINKFEAKLNEKKKVCVRVFDDDYEITINTVFRKTTIYQLIINYLEILQDLHRQSDITTQTLFDSAKLMRTLAVKYFSNFPLPEIKDIKGLIASSNTLIDTGVMEQLFGENGYSKEQIESLETEIDRFAKTIGETQGDLTIKAALNDLKQKIGEENGESGEESERTVSTPSE